MTLAGYSGCEPLRSIGDVARNRKGRSRVTTGYFSSVVRWNLREPGPTSLRLARNKVGTRIAAAQ